MSRLVGKGKKAVEWILTGDNIAPAKTPRPLGLVNHVIPEAEVLLRQAQGLAKKIAMKPATAIAQILKAINVGMEQPAMDSAMAVELEGFRENAASRRI